MKFRNITAIVLCAFPLSAGAATLSPEFTLLRNAIALQGQNLSQDELSADLTAELAKYNETAQAEGRTERLEQATVALGVYTPEQAVQLASEVAGSDGAIGALSEIAAHAPEGAEFSYCALGGGLLVPVALVVLAMGAWEHGATGFSAQTDGLLLGGAAGAAAAIGLIAAGVQGNC